MQVPQPLSQTVTLKDGRTITIETGVWAKQAAGAAVVRMGGTVVLPDAGLKIFLSASAECRAQRRWPP